MLALVVLGACSGDDDEAATTTSSSPAATSGSEGSRQPDAEPCPDVDVPADARDVEAAEGDVDGDGEPDELRSYRIGATDDWRLHVALGAGGGAQAPIVAFGDGVGVLGGADVDGDGGDEVWVRTGAGASATIIGLVRYDACELAQVTFGAGTPADLPVGGSVGTSAGLECAAGPDADLTAYRTTLVGGEAYEVSATEHALEGTVLVERGTTERTVRAGDVELFRYSSFSCGRLSL